MCQKYHIANSENIEHVFETVFVYKNVKKVGKIRPNIVNE